MQNRVYNIISGFSILAGLYFSIPWLLYAVIAVFLVEGLTGFYLIRKSMLSSLPELSDLSFPSSGRFSLPSSRVWRLLVSFVLILTYVFFYNQMWFFPWFMGFAIFGAGVSGVCPIYLGLKYIGFR